MATVLIPLEPFVKSSHDTLYYYGYVYFHIRENEPCLITIKPNDISVKDLIMSGV